MTWTDAEGLRIATIETLLNQLQVAVSNLATQQQIRQLTLIKQRQIDDLTSRIESLERQVQLLEGSLL